MFRYIVSCVFILTVIILSGSIFFPSYWVHRFDEVITRHARVYRLDERLVWNLIYEETYFRPWSVGAAQEIGLMQVTPAVAREWAKETGFKEFEKQAAENVNEFLLDPERNIQIGCWYLEKLREQYRNRPAQMAMMLAAYNAGSSRVEEWTKEIDASIISEAEFLERIAIPSTRAYVTSILTRYRSERSSAR